MFTSPKFSAFHSDGTDASAAPLWAHDRLLSPAHIWCREGHWRILRTFSLVFTSGDEMTFEDIMFLRNTRRVRRLLTGYWHRLPWCVCDLYVMPDYVQWPREHRFLYAILIPLHSCLQKWNFVSCASLLKVCFFSCVYYSLW